MSDTVAEIGYGFALEYSATGAGEYTQIAEILDIKVPTVTTDKVVIQRNDSPDLYGEKIPGWKEASDLEATVVYNHQQAVTLYGYFEAQTLLYWRFRKPDDTHTGTFRGFVCEMGDENPLKDKMMNVIKIAVSGKYSFNAVGGS